MQTRLVPQRNTLHCGRYNRYSKVEKFSNLVIKHNQNILASQKLIQVVKRLISQTDNME